MKNRELLSYSQIQCLRNIKNKKKKLDQRFISQRISTSNLSLTEENFTSNNQVLPNEVNRFIRFFFFPYSQLRLIIPLHDTYFLYSYYNNSILKQMININIAELQKILSRCQMVQQIKIHFENFNKKYSNLIVFSPPEEVFKKANKINEKTKLQAPIYRKSNESERFAKGQSTVFNWVVTAYCGICSLTLEKMLEKNFKDLHEVFQNKSVLFLKYQVLSLINNPRPINFFSTWNQEEEQLLTSIVSSKKRPFCWKDISFELFRDSDGQYYHQQYDCKNQWHNHLNPTILRGNWTVEEEIQLLINCKNHHCNWEIIKRQMNSKRTERNLKNRYKAILRRFELKQCKNNVKEAIVSALQHLKGQLKPKKKELSMNKQSGKHHKKSTKRSFSSQDNLSRSSNRSSEKRKNINFRSESEQYEIEQEQQQQHGEKCWNDMMMRSRKIQRLILRNEEEDFDEQKAGDQLTAIDEEHPITYLCSFPNYYYQDPTLMQNICDEKVYPYDNEWLQISDQNQTARESCEIFQYSV